MSSELQASIDRIAEEHRFSGILQVTRGGELLCEHVGGFADRAHRIGQTRRVFAYRLVAKGTVEEKVIELQSRKRALADAIITAENSLIRDLTRADLEALLS